MIGDFSELTIHRSNAHAYESAPILAKGARISPPRKRPVVARNLTFEEGGTPEFFDRSGLYRR